MTPTTPLRRQIEGAINLGAVLYTVTLINLTLWPMGAAQQTAAAFYDLMLLQTLWNLWRGHVLVREPPDDGADGGGSARPMSLEEFQRRIDAEFEGEEGE